MADQRNGGIAWTDQTWNCIRGCSRVSEGCRHCYAETMAARFAKPGEPYAGTIRNGKWSGLLVEVPEHLTDPLRWQRPRRVFVNSMSDLFHDNVSDDYITKVFAVMALAGRHQFQVLTKRPARMRAFVNGLHGRAGFARLDAAARELGWTLEYARIPLVPWPIPNIWLGVSIEDQDAADLRIPDLLATPAAVRFVSAEPLLGPVSLASAGGGVLDVLTGIDHDGLTEAAHTLPARLDWVIVGGESGPGARPCHIDWIATLVEECRIARTPCFVKQLGALAVRTPAGSGGDDGVTERLVLAHPKGGNVAEFPPPLRVRAYPEPWAP